jgi:Fe-S-cluster containining protein
VKRRDKHARRKRKRGGPGPPPPQQVRPRLNAQDRVMVALGFDIPGFIRAQQDGAVAALEADRSVASVERAIAAATDAAARELKRHLAMLPPNPPIACDAGCAHCCSLHAEVRPAEAVRIAEHLRATLPPERLEALRRRIVEVARRTVAMDHQSRPDARIACSLLEDARCSAYEVRPFVCRACNAADPVSCEQSLGDPAVTNVVYAPQHALYHYAGAAMVRAQHAVGLGHELVELNAALAVALSVPDAARRWLAGEAIFADVRANPIFTPAAQRFDEDG